MKTWSIFISMNQPRSADCAEQKMKRMPRSLVNYMKIHFLCSVTNASKCIVHVTIVINVRLNFFDFRITAAQFTVNWMELAVKNMHRMDSMQWHNMRSINGIIQWYSIFMGFMRIHRKILSKWSSRATLYVMNIIWYSLTGAIRQLIFIR